MKIIRNSDYLRSVKTLFMSVGAFDYDTDAASCIIERLDHAVATEKHGFLTQVGLSVTQEASWDNIFALELYDADYEEYLAYYEVADLEVMAAWFYRAEASKLWVLSSHYAAAVTSPATPYDLLDHPEMVQKAYIDGLDATSFDKFYRQLDYDLDCAVELGKGRAYCLSKLDDICKARLKSEEENIPPFDVQYRKLLRDGGEIHPEAVMPQAYVHYVIEQATIDRNWCEPYCEEWYWFDELVASAKTFLK